MKKSCALLLIVMMALTLFAPAALGAETFDTVTVGISPILISSRTPAYAVISIYDGDTYEWLDVQGLDLALDETYCTLTFRVPQYEIGKSFLIRVVEGAQSLSFEDQMGDTVRVQTYAYDDPSGTRVNQTTFYMDLMPHWTRALHLSVDGADVSALAMPYLDNGTMMVSAGILAPLGLKSTLQDGALTVSSENHSFVFYAGDIYAVRDGVGINLPAAAAVKDGTFFLPLRALSDCFSCNLNAEDDGYTFRGTLTYSDDAWTAIERKINARNITSETQYMVWISKSEFTVRVFEGSENRWHMIRSFPCAIGAPGTPTCEGMFRYYQYQDRWTYPNYFCGPILRFREGGYAMHSTLQRYDGSAYDARVGMRISHGCVRIPPEHINWLAKILPLYSRVYISA